VVNKFRQLAIHFPPRSGKQNVTGEIDEIPALPIALAVDSAEKLGQ
jgi:hypothetical protein